MKKLRRQIFTVLVTILTLFIISILVIVNIDMNNRYDELTKEIIHIGNSYSDPNLVPTNFRAPLLTNIETSLATVQDKRQSLIYASVISFVFLEIFTIYISHILTKWLTRPTEEAFARQQQFISDASHELKTPLAIILASAEMLEANPKETKYLDNIKSETEKMTHLVTNLLELSKSEESTTATFSETNLSTLVETSALTFESLIFEQQLKLNLQITPNITFACDPDRIRELLSILIDNAIKHAYKNSKITVSLTQVKNIITLSVINRGNAIPESERSKIFERFYRSDKARNRTSGSYGLGLAIAKNIATTHSGQISVDCENGYTTFTVKFLHK